MNKYFQIIYARSEKGEGQNNSLIFDLVNRMDTDDFIELRFQRYNKKLCCIIGCNETKYDYFTCICNNDGYITDDLSSDSDILNCIETTLPTSVLCRKMVSSVSSIEIKYFGRNESYRRLCYLLSGMRECVGFSIYVWKEPYNNASIVNHVKTNEKLQNYTILNMVEGEELFCGFICVYGKGNEHNIICTELKTIFSGLESYSITDNDIENKEIFYSVKKFLSNSKYSANNVVINRLIVSFTKHEMNELLEFNDMVGQIGGLSININSLLGERLDICDRDEKNSIVIGNDLNTDVEQRIDLEKIRQGVLLVGAPGSGKGNQIFMIAEQLHKLNIPFLIFESAKQELHFLHKSNPDLKTWRIQSGGYVLNPFSIPKGVTLGEYRQSLIQMLNVCFKLDGALEEWFKKTINSCFSKMGYKEDSTADSSDVKKWGIHEFIIEFNNILLNSGYSQKTQDDMKQAGLIRLSALLSQNPDVFDSVNSIPLESLLDGYNLIQLNCLPTIQSKQLFATMLLISVGAYMQLRFKHSEKPLNLVIIMDESHNLLNSVADVNGSSFSFADDFTNMMLTLRSVGVGFVVSDQSVNNIPKAISDVCNTKVFIGPSRFSGIESYQDYLGESDLAYNAIKYLHLLNSGEGVYVSSEMKHGVFFKTPNRIDTYQLADDYYPYNQFVEDNQNYLCSVYSECSCCGNYKKAQCTFIVKRTARQIAESYFSTYGVKMAETLLEYNKKKNSNNYEVHKKLRSCIMLFLENGSLYNINVYRCAMIQLIRIINRECNNIVTPNNMKILLMIIEKCFKG